MIVTARTMEREVTGQARIRPNGDHQLEFSLGYGPSLLLTQAECGQLSRLIANFATTCRMEDGHSNRMHEVIRQLETY